MNGNDEEVAVMKYITLEDAQDITFGKEIISIDPVEDTIGFAGYSIRFQDKDHTKVNAIYILDKHILLLKE